MLKTERGAGTFLMSCLPLLFWQMEISTNALNLITFNGISPHPIPLPCLRRSGFAQAGQRGEGRVRGPHVKEINVFVLVIDETQDRLYHWNHCEALRPCLPAGRHPVRTGQARRGFPAR